MIFLLGELFCGAGGLGWGAVHADIGDSRFRIVPVWATDYNESACATYRHNICPDDPESVICEDVRTLDMDKLEPIDALAFGFPCNDFSAVGKRKGVNGSYGALYTYGIAALKKFQPKFFVAENVDGLRGADGGSTFKKILREMQSAGYTVTPHLYKSEDYGIPQARHRVVIVGIRNDQDVWFRVPSPAPYAHIDNTCRTALESPPIPADASNNERTRHLGQVVTRLNHIQPGRNAFTADLDDSLALRVKGAAMSQIYKRLDPDKPSYTVTAAGGGGTHIYHWSEPRALTNRERARLQTFPDTYEFMGTRTEVRKQIGMAVPCRGAQIIFEAVLKCFAGIEYAYVRPHV